MKRIRRGLAIVILLCLVTGILTVPYSHVEEVKAVEYEEYEGWKYEVLGDGTIKIKGYVGTATEITIPSKINGHKVVSLDIVYLSHCLESITLPETIINVGSDFSSLFLLKNIEVDNRNEYFASFDGVLYNKELTKLLVCPSKKTDVYIPESVIEIGELVFRDCSNLESIVVNDKNQYYSSLEGNLYDKNQTTLVCCPSKKAEINIPEGVTVIQNYALYGCNGLNSVILPESVISIGDYAFGECSGLQSITLSNGLTSIGRSAFGGCINLSDIILPEGITSIKEETFCDCQKLDSIVIPENVTSIGGNAFSGCYNLKSVTLPKGITCIDYSTFLNCRSLSTISIPEGVTSIGEFAFSQCYSLSSITIPNAVTSIGDYAFGWCEKLNSIIIPENVTSVGDAVFFKCYALRKITNNSTAIVRLIDKYGREINPDVWWYDAATGKCIDELGTGVAIAGEKSEEIDKADILLEIGAGFVDKDGNDVEIGNVVIEKETLILPDEIVIRAAENIVKNMSELSKIFYYDLSAYINKIGGEPAILNGYVTIKLNYPSGITKEYNIVVLHNTEPIEDVKKYDDYFTFKTNGFSPFTVIAIEESVPDKEQIRDFVNRLYTLVLQRGASEDEIGSWTDALIDKRSNGVDAGYGFVFSDECKEKNLSNADFVEILYNTFMNRASDEGGKTAWVSQLDAGVEREKVFEGFIYSAEFSDICSKYGINVGSVSDVGRLEDALTHYRNQNADITKFVARCYTEAMERDYEADGLEAWCKVIIEKSNTPKQVAQNFIFSDEFTQKNLDSTEYVKVLYRTFMGREADEDGLAAWVNVLESGREDRAKVLEGFSDSAEFAEILASFGLN